MHTLRMDRGLLHPRYFLRAWRELDTEAAAARAALGGVDYRPSIVLPVAAFCLLLIHYLKFTASFEAFLAWLSIGAGFRGGHWQGLLVESGFFALTAYCWWWIWHVVGYVLIPVLVIKGVFRERVRDYGLRVRGLGRHLQWYALLAAPILCFAVLASFRADFIDYYPFYRLASRSWLDLLIWESLYLSQFVCLEFFFRGFLLQGCKTAFGADAILVMCLPYAMIHFVKPWLEATGAIFFGLFLGMLALRSRSIWGGVLVHVTIALSMDLLALWQQQGLPGRWWP